MIFLLMPYRSVRRLSYAQPRLHRGEALIRHFSEQRPKAVPLRVLEDRPLIGYNSHGEWSTLDEIREVETERGNYFPRSLKKFPGDTPAIWICLTKRKALRYAVLAEDWERVDDPSQPLNSEEKEMMKGIAEVRLLPTDIIALTDGDEGYLVLRQAV